MDTSRYYANVEKQYANGHGRDYANDWAYGYELSVALGKGHAWVDMYAAAAAKVRANNGDMSTAIELTDSWMVAEIA
jgi:hypothetical protein